jgi:hypothetical protein
MGRAELTGLIVKVKIQGPPLFTTGINRAVFCRQAVPSSGTGQDGPGKKKPFCKE